MCGMNLNPCNLGMLEDTFLLGMAHLCHIDSNNEINEVIIYHKFCYSCSKNTYWVPIGIALLKHIL